MNSFERNRNICWMLLLVIGEVYRPVVVVVVDAGDATLDSDCTCAGFRSSDTIL